MNTNNRATVTPSKAATKGSPSAAAGQKASGQQPPASKKASGTSASARKKRIDKLGAHIVELIESQEPSPITPYISTLAMEMVAANAQVTDRVEYAKKFDLSTAHSDNKWLPSNIKKIKIGLEASQYEGDDEYKQIDAKVKALVEKFKNDLNHIYYELAALEEKLENKQRLSTFTTQAFNLFKIYTKYYGEIDDLGTLSPTRHFSRLVPVEIHERIPQAKRKRQLPRR
jgi:hypothetical protein